MQFYEVVEGNIVNDRQYTGIILRDERVENTDRAGYINYYIREGKRAAIGTRIYSIDETGNMAELMQENPDANVGLTDANLSDVKRQLSSFSIGDHNILLFARDHIKQLALIASRQGQHNIRFGNIHTKAPQ